MKGHPVFIELPSAPMQEIYRKIQQVAESDLSFFILGETGVGKEGVAQYIHKNSSHQDKLFIPINCGRFTAEFLQSELFGHEEGAFTGANRQRKGAFERINGGTLFLDEVTEMSEEAQKMFLRVLDTKTFTRLGGNETLTADFQIIAATNRNIGEAVLKAEFRADLYYRLANMTLNIPPLRERTEDIAPLVGAFIDEFNIKDRPGGVTGITPAALVRLEQASWPGNIRQLRSTIETAVALATTNNLEVKDFPYNFFTLSSSEKSIPPPDMENTSDYPESVHALVSIWQTLPLEIRQTIIRELSKHLPELSHNFETSHTLATDENSELLNIKDMNQHEILREVAQKRIAECASLSDAAHSLDIDIRTLQKHASWQQ